MQVVVQRVSRAAVRVDGKVVGSIGTGLFALVGVGHRTDPSDAAFLAQKTAQLRVFPDDGGRMNRSLQDVGGEVLAVSQFTLYGDVSKGRRPSFVDAAPPDRARALYQEYCTALRDQWGVAVAEGVFGAHMVIEVVADGPVTLQLQRESGGLSQNFA